MLTNAEIQSRDIIEDAASASFRGASYDLRIGQLIDPKGNTVASYEIPPRGIVEVISQERVRLPTDVCGMAMVKTGLCQEGILALSIGIIDPGFDGKISSFLINFGKQPRLLQSGEVFLRTVYHALAAAPQGLKPVHLDDVTMLQQRKRASVEKFDPTFLSLDSVADESAKRMFKNYKNQALAYVSAFALGLALLTFLVNFSTIWLKWPDGPVAVVGAPASSVEVQKLIDENADLRRRLSTLEERSQQKVTEGRGNR